LSTLTEATATASHIENDKLGTDELQRDVLKAAVGLRALPPRKPSDAQLPPQQTFSTRPEGNGGNSYRRRSNHRSLSRPSQISSRPGAFPCSSFNNAPRHNVWHISQRFPISKQMEHGKKRGSRSMPHHHPLTITVNDQLTVDAGYWQKNASKKIKRPTASP
jgi:hypothetical protein